MENIFKDQKELKMLEAIIETAFDGMYITDGNANTIFINKSYERITGLKREDLLGHNMADLVSRGIISEATSFWVLKNKVPKTVHQTFNTGKSALVTSTPFFDESGEIQMIVSNVRDITELKILHEEVKLSKNENLKYKNIIEELKLQIANSEYIIAHDEKMLNLLTVAKRIARVDTTVLIYGETGCGKEVLAKYIYDNSSRVKKPFIKINCGAIPETLIESEFFGYEEGSFTGARTGGKMGVFEVSNNGTLFLDEIGELPLNMQVKLLRALQDGEIMKIGGTKSIKVNVRIIAATNCDLKELVKSGKFREDLFYRLNVVPLTIIPLRGRRGDIMPIVEYYLKMYNEKYGYSKKISSEALKYLYEYCWPGNVREVKNLVERLVVTVVDSEINYYDLPCYIVDDDTKNDSLKNNIPKLDEAIENVEKDLILRAYAKHQNVRAAALELGIAPSTFVRKRQKYAGE